MSYMEMELEVIGCCGLSALVGIPNTKEEFKQQAIKEVKRIYSDFYDELKDKYLNGAAITGSHVMLTVADYQEGPLEYLPKLGFRKVSTQLNTNSGNRVSIFLMGRAKFNRKLEDWRNGKD
jgi:chloramphenicol O-acetyltransferase